MSDEGNSIEEDYKNEIEEFSDVEVDEHDGVIRGTPIDIESDDENTDDSSNIDEIDLDFKDILSDMSDNIVDIQVGIEVLKREYRIVSVGLGALVLLNIIVSLIW